jgi:type VI secretion system protein ImpI
MQLALQIISNQAAAMGQNASKVFGEAGGTIGRVPGNDWVLPDDERFVSGLHIIIRCMGGMFSLEDVSTNGTFLNDGPEAVGAKNEPVILKSGDRIAIGDYQVYCNIIESGAKADISQPSPIPALTDFEPVSVGDIAVTSGQQAVAPKADIIVPDTPGIGPVDPLDLLGDAPVQPVVAPATFPDHSSAMSDNFIAPEPLSSAPPTAGAIPDNWDLTDFGRNQSEAGQPEAPMVPPVAPPIAPPAPVGEIPNLAEKPVALSGAESVYAELFPLIVQGMMDVLTSRAEIKNQFRLSVTTIKAVDNNPLKFSPTADAAIDQLFHKPQAGYLDATQAFEEGFGDIKAHQLAMMAGMRAAFEHMLKQFSPDLLEEYFESGGKRGKFLGMGSKNRYWDMYRDFFDRTTRDSDDNFRRLFGEEFAEAYEQQMQQLTRKS